MNTKASSLILFCAFIVLTSAAPKLGQKFSIRNLFRTTLEGYSKATPGERIIGGNEVKPNSIPYQVFLELQHKDGGKYCGGSLITKNYVLTAAQCTNTAQSAIVILGAHDRLMYEKTQYRSKSNEFIDHPEFNPLELINDISLIKLSEPIVLNEYINTVVLEKNVQNSFVGKVGRVSGWGTTNHGNFWYSDVLHATTNQIIDNNLCSKLSDDEEILSTQICMSGAGKRSTCVGDYGGPLVIDDVQIGVAFYNAGICSYVEDEEFPSQFTRVSSFYQWIKENSDLDN